MVKNDVKVTRMNLTKGEGGIKAFVDAEFYGELVVRDLKVAHSENNGLFVAMPSTLRTGNDGKAILDRDGKKIYDPKAFPCSRAVREVLNEAVLEHYEANKG